MNGKSKLAGKTKHPNTFNQPKWDREAEACGEVYALGENRYMVVGWGQL